MKFLVALHRRLPWLNISAGMLVVFLQRSPAVRVMVQAKDYAITSRAGELLRAVFTVAGLGALHSRAGATTFRVQQGSTVVIQNGNDGLPTINTTITGTVGTPITAIAFTYLSTPSSPATFQFSGSLPPGLTFSPTPIGNVIRSSSPAVQGTPTVAGTYTIRVQGFNAEGLTNSVQQTITFEIAGPAVVAPAFTTQPQSQTVTVGANVTFTAAASGSPTYQWRKDGVDITGATAATLTLTNVQTSASGAYTVIATNSGGPTTSNAATLTVNPPVATAPVIVSHPLSFTAAVGSTAALSVVATGTGNNYEWKRGATVVGTNSATLILPAVTAAAAGSYTVTVSNGAGQPVTSNAAVLQVGAGEGRLLNLSVRANLAASQRLIVGFAANGSRRLLIRGVGPTLGAFGVTGAYADPQLELFRDSTMINRNDDWSASLVTLFAQLGAFALTNGSKDAALDTSLSGAHTAQLTGPSSGITLVEVYDAGEGNAVRLINVSARNFVGTGDDILIAGFVVTGSVGKTLLIRAVGPTLAGFGVPGTLANPKLEIYKDGAKISENDDWAAALASVFTSVGAFQLTASSGDSALLVTLPPGAYSAQVSGVANGTGEALVEVYEVP
ncbi:MAG TPA: immunoglobulin domain-containing protein [Opitutaceae bacterium]